MSLYTTTHKEIFKKYHQTDNPVTKSTYRNILKNRAERGSIEARKYLNLIEGGKRG